MKLLKSLSTLVLIVVLVLVTAASRTVTASRLDLRSLRLSESDTSAANVRYDFAFSTISTNTIGSISFTICANYLYNPGDICVTPAGLDISQATLQTQTGITGFSLLTPSSANTLIISRTAAVAPPQSLEYVFAGITNPAALSTSYVRIATHASTNGSGPELDSGTVTFATNANLDLTTEVPPYLLFCSGITINGFNCGTATGNTINFGELSSKNTRTATSQLLASTNAPYGYTVTLAGATMTAGNNVIPAMNSEASQVGRAQFGLNALLNSLPLVGADPEGPGLTTAKTGYNVANSFRFKSGEVITGTSAIDDYRKFTISYIVNIPADQPIGRYVATVSYICLANF